MTEKQQKYILKKCIMLSHYHDNHIHEVK